MKNDIPSASAPSGRRRYVVVLAALVCLFALAAIVYQSKRIPAVDEATGQRQEPESEDQDARNRRLVTGVWEDNHEGKRTMTLKPDGTGTMVVELTGLKAALAARRMRFDMTWSVHEGRLQKQTTGGEPATTVQMILKTMGDRVDEPILELTPERLLLLDKDGETRYDWKRPTPKPAYP